MSPFKDLVTTTPLGHYALRTDLNQEKNHDLYTITCQLIDKIIITPIIMVEPELSFIVDGMLLWQHLNFQLLKKNMDYLAQKKFKRS